MASQTTKITPKMAPPTPGKPGLNPKKALPQTDKPNLEGAAVIPEGIVNPPPPNVAGRDEIICQILKASAFCEAKAGQGHTADQFPLATTSHHHDRTFSAIFVRRQRGLATSPVLADNMSKQKCATSTRIRHFSCQCPFLADNPPEQKCATSTSETNLFSCWLLMLALGSHLGHKMASKICKLIFPKPKMHPIASQHGLPSTNNDPKMALETLGMACLSPKMAS